MTWTWGRPEDGARGRCTAVGRPCAACLIDRLLWIDLDQPKCILFALIRGDPETDLLKSNDTKSRVRLGALYNRTEGEASVTAPRLAS